MISYKHVGSDHTSAGFTETVALELLGVPPKSSKPINTLAEPACEPTMTPTKRRHETETVQTDGSRLAKLPSSAFSPGSWPRPLAELRSPPSR